MPALLTWTAASKTGTTVAGYRPREAGVVLATLTPAQLSFTDSTSTTGTAYDVVADFADGTSVTSLAVVYVAPQDPTVGPDSATQTHTAASPVVDVQVAALVAAGATQDHTVAAATVTVVTAPTVRLSRLAVGDFVLGTTKPSLTNAGVPAGWIPTQTTVGNLTVTVAGTVIEDRRIEGVVSIQAINVTLRRCEIVGPATVAATGGVFLVNVTTSGGGFVIEQSTIQPRAVNESTEGLRGQGFTARRCKIVDCVDIVGTTGPAVVLEGNYFGAMSYFTPCTYQASNDTHNDIWQMHAGTSGPVSRGNTYDAYYGTRGTHQPIHNGSGPIIGAATGVPSPCCMMMTVGSNLTIGLLSQDDWFGGGLLPVNGSGYPGLNIGTIHRGKFSGNSQPITGGTRAIDVSSDSTLDAGGTPTTGLGDAGGSTVNKNVLEGTSTAAIVRRNQ